MSELGHRLKQAREEKHLSLDDIQNATKIQKRYLLAIERGEFSSLPGKFYARAFIKNYAEAVGLDSEQLFHEFGNELPDPQKEVSDLPSRTHRTKKQTQKASSGRSALPAIVGTVLLIGFLAVVWFFWPFGNSSELSDGIAPDETEQPFDGELSENLPDDNDEQESIDEEPTSEETIEETTEEESLAEEESSEPNQQLTLVGTEGNQSYFTLTGTERFEAEIVLTGRSYVRVRNAMNKQWYAGEPTEGEVLTFDLTGEEEIEFNFGASPFATLFINGEELEFPLDEVFQKVIITTQAE